MRKKILIDGRFIGVGDSIGRVVFGILEHLLKIDEKNDYSLLIRPVGIKQVKEHCLWDHERLQIEVLDVPHYSLEEQTKLLIWLNKKPYDLVYFTQFNHPIMYRRPYIIIIHDLTTFGYFRYENPLKVAMFKKVMRSAVINSRAIISDSKATKAEILENYPISPKKISVIYLGIDKNYLRIAAMDQAERMKLGEKFKKSYHLSGDYLLYTGMWKKHKNLKRLLQAFQKLKIQNSKLKMSEGIQLVLAGKIDYEEPEIVAEIEKINGHKIENGKNSDPVFVAGFIPEELLPSAYAGALAYVQPSLNEGFGLPPLEAFACGTPVVAGKISATPEILGDAAYYFDPERVDDMAKKISDIIENRQLRLELREKGLRQVQKYTWEENARENLALIKEVLG